MESYNEHIEYLIIQYSKGVIDSEGTDELLSWVEKTPENKTYFKEQLALLRSIQTPDVKIDSHKSLSEFYKFSGNNYQFPLAIKITAVAASIAFILILGKVLIKNLSKDQPELIEYIAREKNLLKILNDSSEVTLSKNSVLLAPKEFNTKTRDVELIGKAFFEVAKDENRPFTVNCQNIKIKVTGTGFEVKADTLKNMVTVTVASGEVSVSHVESNLIKFVSKGNQITLSQEGEIISESEIRNDNYLSWKTGILRFKNARMSDVAEELTKLYEKQIIFMNDSIKSQLITLKSEKQSLSEITKMLEIILQAKISENNDTLFIAKNN
jgi:ferric-dicitrate binding protein FerR (iron transport regulator)